MRMVYKCLNIKCGKRCLVGMSEEIAGQREEFRDKSVEALVNFRGNENRDQSLNQGNNCSTAGCWLIYGD